MNKGIIITLPRYDYVTEYISDASEDIIKEAEKRNIKVKSLPDKNATRKNFESALKKLDFKMVIFNGHGSEDAIYGHKDEIIVKCGTNADLLTERLIYARSCDAAVILGEECMKNTKDGCFIGYKLPFMLYIDSKRISNPHKDAIAPLFLGPSNLVPISLIKGNTAFQAHENSKKQILKNINKLLRKGDDESFWLAGALWNNYTGQVIIGNNSSIL